MQSAPSSVPVSTPENVEAMPADKEKMELSPEEEAKILEGKITALDEQISGMQDHLKDRNDIVNEAMLKLGLSPSNTPSNDEKALQEKIEARKELARRKQELTGEKESELENNPEEELLTPEEKRELIEAKKAEILNDRLEEFFKLFEDLSKQDQESMRSSGQMSGGRGLMETPGMGRVDPELAQNLAKLFEEGIKLLPEILKRLPDLIKQFDAELEKEAIDAVDKEIEAAKKKLAEEKEAEKEKESVVADGRSDEKTIEDGPGGNIYGMSEQGERQGGEAAPEMTTANPTTQAK